jgi:hypothetical protein
MRLLPVLLVLILIFTACGRLGLKPGGKKPVTGSTPQVEQPVTSATPQVEQPVTTATPQNEQPVNTPAEPVQTVSNAKLSIVLPQDFQNGNGYVGTIYVFTVKGEGMPGGVKYMWYVNEKPIADGNDLIYEFTEPKPYSVKVLANWVDGNGAAQMADSSITANIQPASNTATTTTTPAPTNTNTNTTTTRSPATTPSLTLSIPMGAGGPGVPYHFVAKPVNIPAGAMYTWYINGIDVQAGGIDEVTADAPAGFFAGGQQYSIRVVATWKNSSGTFFTTSASGVFTCSR